MIILNLSNFSLSLDMPTVAPGWPDPYSSHEVSTDTIVHRSLGADCSEQKQLTTENATTEIGVP